MMAVLVCGAGIAQAAHFHKAESGSHGDVHLQCLLCMHAERGAAPAIVPPPLRFQVAWSVALRPWRTLDWISLSSSFFRARAPPVL